jgi:hypothetical protein
MRVDSCTTQVKECLQSEDRCGADYTQCVGLDNTEIRALCPADKLVGCQENGAFDWERVDNIVGGIYLSIDNELMEQCEVFAESKMAEICGDTFNCDAAFANDDSFGAEMLAINTTAADEMEIIGLVDFSKIAITETTGTIPTIVKYTATGEYSTLSQQNVDSVINKTNRIIAMLGEDTKIKMCVDGRNMEPIRGQRTDRNSTTTARFPRLLDEYARIVIQSGLEHAKLNYEQKLKNLMKDAMTKMADIKKAAGDISGGGMCYDKSIMGDLDFIKK